MWIATGNMWLAISGFFGIFIIKVHAGSIYPSDILANLAISGLNLVKIPNFNIIWLPFLVIILMLKPICLFKKTPLWICGPVSISIFETYLSEKLTDLNTEKIVFIAFVQATLFFTSFAIGDVILGRRVGQIQATI